MVLFSLSRALLFALGIFALLLQLSLARPLVPAQTNYISKRSLHTDPLFSHDMASIDRALDEAVKSKIERSRRTKPLAPTKLELSPAASQELDNMGLHGKKRKEVIKWHKAQVKAHMRNDPYLKGKGAETGTIEHLVHTGGSNPKERNHITASFEDKKSRPITNNFNDGNHHHIYVHTMQGLPPQAKAAWNKNNAKIRGQARTHQTSLGKTASSGKSRTKGKGRQNPERNFSKNSRKGFQRRKGRR